MPGRTDMAKYGHAPGAWHGARYTLPDNLRAYHRSWRSMGWKLRVLVPGRVWLLDTDGDKYYIYPDPKDQP